MLFLYHGLLSRKRINFLQHYKNNLFCNNPYISNGIAKTHTNAPIQNVIIKIQINNIDLIFIDGGHDYTTVKNDLDQSKKIISQSGTILCDDYNLSYAEGVKKAIDEFIKENSCKYEILLERFVKINL